MSENPYRAQVRNYLINQFSLPTDQIESMLPDLFATLGVHIEKLEEALDGGDMEQLGKAGHTIKGALLNLGLNECAEIALGIEMSSRSGVDHLKLKEMVQAIRLELEPYLG